MIRVGLGCAVGEQRQVTSVKTGEGKNYGRQWLNYQRSQAMQLEYL